eukprot:2970973-Amphidinium_carterae.2
MVSGASSIPVLVVVVVGFVGVANIRALRRGPADSPQITITGIPQAETRGLPFNNSKEANSQVKESPHRVAPQRSSTHHPSLHRFNAESYHSNSYHQALLTTRHAWNLDSLGKQPNQVEW